MGDTRLVVCVNERLGAGQKSCAGSGSRELIKEIRKLFAKADLDVKVVEQVCLGRCEEGITMRIAPGGPFFTEVTKHDLNGIVEAIKNFCIYST